MSGLPRDLDHLFYDNLIEGVLCLPGISILPAGSMFIEDYFRWMDRVNVDDNNNAVSDQENIKKQKPTIKQTLLSFFVRLFTASRNHLAYLSQDDGKWPGRDLDTVTKTGSSRRYNGLKNEIESETGNKHVISIKIETFNFRCVTTAKQI